MRVDSRERLGEFVARAFVATLFVFLSVNLWTDFVRTGRVTGLFFLASEALVVVLTIVRRPAHAIDRSIKTTILTVVSVAGPPLVRAGDTAGLVPDLMTAAVSIVGATIVIAGKVTIGRSFGLVPANRGIVARGPYSVVRHPIYAGYLLVHAAALTAYPSLWNVAVIITGDIALVLRALAEERVLSADREYQEYCGRVAWHLVPGVF